MKKAKTPGEAIVLDQIPNIGRSLAEDLRGIGIRTPKALVGKDPLRLYQTLNQKTGIRHDPCVLDTFMAAVAFMNGEGAKPWWAYTPQRKAMARVR